jgi:DNA repair protein RadA/Sms
MSITVGHIPHETRIAQIVVPEKLKLRFPFHNDNFERLFFVTSLYGGLGLTPSTVTLFTGTPSAGKSTLALQMADALHRLSDCVVLFNGIEESLYQTKTVCERLFKHEPDFYVGEDSLVDDTAKDLHYKYYADRQKGQLKTILGHARKLQAKHPDKHLVLFIDSLQMCDDGKYPDGHINNQTPVRALDLINSFCKKTMASAIIIGQVNKDGDAAGSQKLIHKVDTHLHMYIDKKEKSETQGFRVITAVKHRYGSSGATHILQMRENGLEEVGSLGV